MSCGSKRAGRTVEATNSGSQQDSNSNAGRRRERQSWARLSASVSRRLVMNRPLIGGRDLVALRCSSWNSILTAQIDDVGTMASNALHCDLAIQPCRFEGGGGTRVGDDV